MSGSDDELLHTRVLRQARRTPHAAAVSHASLNLTYAQLVERAGEVAVALRRRGIGAGDLVAVLADRSPGLIVAMLGVCFAGAAYLPLDGSYPDEQLETMLSDAAVHIVLCDDPAAARAPVRRRIAISIDHIGQNHGDAPATPAPAHDTDACGDRLLYVIYTSGSTGTPKGVMVTHRNVVRLLAGTVDRYGFGPDDIWTFFHSFAFDFSVWEIWGALCTGGRLAVVDRLTARDPDAFYDLVAREGVTVLNQTPSAFTHFDQIDARRRSPLRLRTVIFGGERLDPAGLRGWFGRHGFTSPRLVNMYGITETTVHVTHHTMRPTDLDRAGSPIGVPLDDLRVSVRDADGAVVPAGDPGELYIAGPGLSLGYLNRPDLTRDRFPEIAGQRWYRSGDIGVWRDGELEYVGRADRQVKIRGHRVELGQVEAALMRSPGVRQAIALAADGRLVAYVAADADAFETAASRAQLETILPPHAVPSALVRCDRFPLTANGKVDLAALPAVDGNRPEMPTPYRCAADELQERMCAVWAETLGLDNVGVDDNFFALGGDSLLAVDLVAKAAGVGIPISVTELFLAPTVAGLCADRDAAPALAAASTTESWTLLAPEDVAVAQAIPGVLDAYPMTALQLAMVFHSTATVGTAVYQNALAVDVHAEFDEDRFARTFEGILGRHEPLRTSFALAGFTLPVQLVHAHVDLPLSVERVADQPGAQGAVEEWIRREKHRKPRFDRAPLVAVHVVATAKAFSVCVRVHHAIMDGWSDALFLNDLIGGYLDAAGPPSPSSPSPSVERPAVRYADFVRATRAARDSAEHTEYWRQALDAATPTFLPTAGTDPEKAEFRRLTTALPPAIAEATRSLAHRMGVPAKAVYQAAFIAAAATATGVDRPTIGVVCNARPETADATQLIGLFLNTLPVTVDAEASSWTALIETTFQAEQRMTPYRATQLADLVAPGAAAPFGLVFNYVRFPLLEELMTRTDIEVGEPRTFDETDFPLLLSIVERDSGGLLEFGYRTDAVSPATADHFSRCYLDYIEQCVQRPDNPCPATMAANRGGPSVLGAIATVAQSRPHTLALVQGDRQLRYGELWSWSGLVAQTLTAARVRPGMLVPVLAGRRIETVVAALGVLRTGAGYVLLEPEWPEARLRSICEQTSSTCLLAFEHRQLGPPIVDIPAFAAATGNADAPAIDEPRQPLAAFFTSGSTGAPKGARVSRRALARLLFETPYGFDAATQLLSMCALPWDFGSLELWAPLVHGGVLHLPEQHLDLPAVRKALAQGVNTLIAPTAFFHLLADEALDIFAGVRTCLVGGETLSPQRAERLLDAYPAVRLFNVYGPVETTGGSTFHRVTAADAAQPEIPIGIPVPGDAVHLVDSHLTPVPPGAVGEILISGAGVADGYLGDLEATRQKFISLAVPDAATVRAYRTGDLGTYGDDGLLRYRGRIGRQTKVNGVRIELAEIEHVAQRVPGVTMAIALAVGESHPHLVVFATGEASPDDIRSALAAALPEPVVPRTILPIAAFPLSLNGKIDFRTLSADPRLHPSQTSAAPEPSGDVLERIVLDEARRVLDSPDLTLADDFFARGGSSLTAIRLAAVVSRAIDAELPVTTILTRRRLDQIVAAARTLAPARAGDRTRGASPHDDR